MSPLNPEGQVQLVLITLQVPLFTQVMVPQLAVATERQVKNESNHRMLDGIIIIILFYFDMVVPYERNQFVKFRID